MNQEALFEQVLRSEAVAGYNYEILSSVTNIPDYLATDIPQDCIPQPAAEEAVEKKMSTLRQKYAGFTAAETVTADSSVRCRMVPQNAIVLLYPGKKLPGAQQAEQDILGRGIGDTVSTQLCGKDITVQILEITNTCKNMTEEEMVRKEGIPGVETVDAYLQWCRDAIYQDNFNLAARKLAGVFLMEIMDKADFHIADGEQEPWLQGCMEAQLGSRAMRGDREAAATLQDPEKLQAAIEDNKEQLESRYYQYLAHVSIVRAAGDAFTAEAAAAVIAASAQAMKLPFEDVMQYVNMHYLLEVEYMTRASNILTEKAAQRLKTVLEG